MVIPSLIQHKRDGNAIAPGDWARLIADYTAGRVPDYQISALLMAIVFRGLEPDELAALTDAMLASGDRLRFDGYAVPRWPWCIFEVVAPTASPSNWWPRQMPNRGLPVSRSFWITGTA